MMHRSIAVIGHVDHGKTALVEALTGTKTDTLAEERARGLTINLGFAHLATPAGMVHFVDAPGHADFVRTTVSGLSGVDAVLLVISAIDGIESQTKEHLKLARLMGLEQAIFALTKCDLAGRQSIDTLHAELKDFASENGLSKVSIVMCSARSPDGMNALKTELETLLRSPIVRPALGGFFLPIDRAFSVTGVGTIVTGTLIGKSIESGTRATIGSNRVVVRGIEIAAEPAERAEPGTRVALNLRGVGQGEIKKGDVLHEAGTFAPSSRFDIALTTEGSERVSFNHMDELMVLIGTQHRPARIRLFGANQDAKNAQFAQLEFRTPIVGYLGQPIILRNPAATQTICGAKILDPNAARVHRNKPLHIAILHAAQTGDPELVAHAIADRDFGLVDLSVVSRLSKRSFDGLSNAFRSHSADVAIRESDLRRAKGDFVKQLKYLHAAHPIRPGHFSADIAASMRHVPASILDVVERELIASGEIQASSSGLALCAHNPAAAMTPAQSLTYDLAATRLLEMGLKPTPLFENEALQAQQKDLIELLVHEGVAVRLYNHALRQNILLHRATIDAARDLLKGAFPAGTQFTTGEARAALSTNRKTVVPLLELFDEQRITQRDEDLRTITQ